MLNATVLLYKVAGQIVSNPLGYGLFRKELLEPALNAMLYAQRAQSATEDSYLKALDELDKAMDRHLIRWTGDYLGHWAQFLDVAVPKDTLFSYIDLAIFFGLDQYILSKITLEYNEYLKTYALHKDDGFLRDYFKEDEFDTERPVRAITLLDIAVRADYSSSKMACILLEHGTDVNETSGYQQISTWDHVLKRAELSSKDDDEAEKWLQIIEAFVQHRVDLRGSYRDADEARRRVHNVIDGFRARHPDQAAALLLLIEKRLPRSKGRRLKLWAKEKLSSRRPSHTPTRPIT